MGGGKVLHRPIHGLDDRQHGLLQLALELRLMGLEPLSAVVAFQAAQESQPGFTKIWFADDVYVGKVHDEME
jgi:hypothetical protein